MEIAFATAKLHKEFNSESLLIRHYGPLQAKFIQRRLSEMRAANCLNDLRRLPQVDCHELSGNRADQLAVNLHHPYRLIFKIANSPIPLMEDGSLDWKSVTAIIIRSVENYHD